MTGVIVLTMMTPSRRLNRGGEREGTRNRPRRLSIRPVARLRFDRRAGAGAGRKPIAGLFEWDKIAGGAGIALLVSGLAVDRP